MRAASILAILVAAGCGTGCPRGRPPADAVDGSAGGRQTAQSLLLQPQGLPPGLVPEPAPAGAARVAVIGDFGTGSAEERAVARMVLAWSPAAVVTTGDNAYPDAGGERLDAFVGAIWGALPGAGRGGAPEERRVFWPAPGNHDWRATGGLGTYLDYFRLPGNGRYYDARLAGGRVHLFALDSDGREPDGIDAGSTQARWLEPRLRASTACLKLVVLHHPPWSSAEHGSKLELRWPFREWGADVVMAGHDHVYERLDVGGMPYFVCGLSGAPAYAFRAPLPETRVRWNQRHGALLVTVGAGRTTYEFWTWAGERVDRLETAGRCP